MSSLLKEKELKLWLIIPMKILSMEQGSTQKKGYTSSGITLTQLKHSLIILICKIIFSFSRLPQWIRSLIPKIFYITEKAWNYYPRTITEYTVQIFLKLEITKQKMINYGFIYFIIK